MRARLKRTCITLLLLALCSTAFTDTSHEQTAKNWQRSSENLDIIVHTFDEGEKDFVGYNMLISFVNATSLPFNVFMAALNDGFQSARFSVTSGVVFLRVSYDAAFNSSKAEAYADDVLGEFRKSFTMTMEVMSRTHVVSNETGFVNVYYQLSSIVRNIDAFEELAKYCPTDGFGQLVTRVFLSFYLQEDFIPRTIVNVAGFDHIEYNLTRNDLSFVWDFGVEVAFQTLFQYQDHIDVSLNELMRHSGNIIPSNQRDSQVHLHVWKKEFTSRKTPLWMTFSSSSPSYTALKEEIDLVTLTYNLTDPIDDIVARINVAPEPAAGQNLLYAVILVSAVCMISVAVLVSIRARRRKLRKTENSKNSK